MVIAIVFALLIVGVITLLHHKAVQAEEYAYRVARQQRRDSELRATDIKLQDILGRDPTARELWAEVGVPSHWAE